MQYLTSTKGSSSALVGGRSCTYVCFNFHCTSLEPFCLFVLCVCFLVCFLHFMVYSVETVTEPFGGCCFFLSSVSIIFFRPPPPPPGVAPPSLFCCFAENYDAYFFKLISFTLLLLLLSMQIMIALRFYARGTFQRVTGDSFGVSL